MIDVHCRWVVDESNVAMLLRRGDVRGRRGRRGPGGEGTVGGSPSVVLEVFGIDQLKKGLN